MLASIIQLSLASILWTVPDTVYQEFYPSGKLKSTFSIKTDSISGNTAQTANEWYENGQFKAIEHYDRNDDPVGSFIYWYENGVKEKEGCYSNQLGDGTQDTASVCKRKPYVRINLVYTEGEFGETLGSGAEIFWHQWFPDGSIQEKWYQQLRNDSIVYISETFHQNKMLNVKCIYSNYNPVTRTENCECVRYNDAGLLINSWHTVDSWIRR